MATDSESTSRPPRSPPRRERRRSLSEERVHSRGGGRDLDEDDHRRERRRQRHSRSPDDCRSKHPRRHRDESRDRERSHRRKRDDTKDDSRRKRSLSRSRGDRNRSRSASRDRHERRRRHRDRSGSPTRPHRKDRTSERSVSPRSSRRSGRGGRSRSRSPKRRKPSTSPSPPRSKRSTKPLPSQEAAYNGNSDSGPVEKPVEKEKPNFNQTGLLAREANMVEGTNIVLKYNEPADARKPPQKADWRLFIFKGKDLLASTPLYSRSCWLFGREVKIADMVLEHPSASKQHAVLQFRHTTRTNEFGDAKSQVRPYLIDLESSNGTFLHKKRIEGSRYVELMPYDVFSFGTSEREYVLMKGDGSDK